MKVKIKDFNGKVDEKEVTVPSKDHLQAQIKYPSTQIKPKKGKGSFKRKNKYNKGEDDER